ncbi:conserved hypothetical protein [Ricinus communis]|uniref:Uncharacterized protein n=1 Tax=Ricinus communis TaxID=3988 RepID=B9SK78_RICCO|nr:conserved hypothetical protein [Ricinus communis]
MKALILMGPTLRTVAPITVASLSSSIRTTTMTSATGTATTVIPLAAATTMQTILIALVVEELGYSTTKKPTMLAMRQRSRIEGNDKQK